MSENAGQIGQVEILRLLRAQVSRLANPDTELDALKQVLGEVRKATGDRERAERLFFEALNFYDGILLGFDWGWRAARWVKPKSIEKVDKIIINLLMKNPKLTNHRICWRLDHRGIKLTDKLKNLTALEKALGKDRVFWLWQKALEKKVHAVEVNLGELRNEAPQFSDALWWHAAATKYYRKHGKLDWARRSAAIKKRSSSQKVKDR
jgi:hypothetical protein